MDRIRFDVVGCKGREIKEIKKPRKLCWNDIDTLDSDSLSSCGAFQSDRIETVTGLGDDCTDKATLVMASDGMSFELTYQCGRAK